MADKEITNLPASQDVTDETLFVVYQPGEMEPAQKVSAEQLKQYTNENIAVTADNIKKALGYTPADPEKTVGVETQTFTDAQKEQARKNIGAVGFGQLPDIVCTAQGEVISLSDSSDRELKGLRIFGRTTQDGTPTPEAPVPLVSVGESGSMGVTVCRKNLVDLLNPVRKNNNLGGAVAITETTNSIIMSGVCSNIWSSAKYVFYLPAGKYTVSTKMETDNGHLDLSIYVSDTLNGSYTFAKSLTASGSVDFTISDGKYAEIRFHLTGGAGTQGAVWTARYYDLYIEAVGNLQHLTVQTPNGLPGVLLGATIPDAVKAKDTLMAGVWWDEETKQYYISDTVDFARGKHIQRVGKYVFDGSDDEGWQAVESSTTSTTGKYRNLCKMFVNVAMTPPTHNDVGNLMCSRYITKSAVESWFLKESIGIEPNGFLLVYDDVYNTSDIVLWEAHLAKNPMTMIFVLVVPIETDLTAEELAQYATMHTNKPNTTIFNDAGAEMEVSYVADTKTYIDNKFAELAAAFVNNA